MDILTMGDSIRVLHVDDDPDFLSLSADALTREDGRFDIITVASPSVGHEKLACHDVDCIVSDYEMPGQNGIEFLEVVREEYPSLPFILFTGKGSEAVASDAFSAGATDYLQKQGGTSQYTVLANRIENAVSKYRAELRSEVEHRRRKRMLDRFIDGYAAFDEQLRFTQVNESAAEFLGLSREEILGKHYDDVQNAEGSDAFASAYEQVLETQEPETVHARSGIHPDRWVEARVFPIEEGLSVYFRDITERKERERELTRERERFQTLFEKFPEPTLAYAYEGGRPVIRAVNTAFEEVFGYDADRAVDTPVDDLVVPTEKLDEAESIDERVQHGELLDREVRRQTVDGERYFNFRNITIPVEDDIDGYAVYEDIDERKEREQELEAKNERLEEFARIVTHDLRNPLNVAESRLTLAQDDCESPHLDDIEDAHERIQAIVEDTLVLVRQDETVESREQVGLEAFTTRCWDGVETDSAELVVVDSGSIRADPERLRHVFENLFRNSVEHSSTSNRTQSDDSVEHGSTGSRAGPDDSVEHSSTSNRTQSDDSVEHGSTGSRAEPDDSVKHGGKDITVRVGTLDDGFFVEDDGSGIAEEIRDDLFEFGTSTNTDGTGFGLPIVEQIVEAHGWEISATESDDGGARFEITGVSFE
jgi:PAS domain S-box-containing protein